MKLTMIGSGDAFGSGGRLQTSFHVTTGTEVFLIDCGATTLIGLQRLNIDPNSIGTIYISHLHGDHYSGLVWFLMHALYVARRSEPLTIAGPPGLEDRYKAASEILFPGSTSVERRHPLTFVEYEVGIPMRVGPADVMTFAVSHPSGAPSCALRLALEGKILAYSGDTEWVETLIPCGKNADLFICECYGYDRPMKYHLNWRALQPNLERIGAKRVLVTHMNTEMLAHSDEARAAGVLIADDGLVVDI